MAKAAPFRIVQHTPPVLAHQHVKSIPITKFRELRVGIATSDTSGSVTIQKFEKDRDGGEMETAGGRFFVFHAEVRLLIKALTQAVEVLDAQTSGRAPGVDR